MEVQDRGLLRKALTPGGVLLSVAVAVGVGRMLSGPLLGLGQEASAALHLPGMEWVGAHIPTLARQEGSHLFSWLARTTDERGSTNVLPPGYLLGGGPPRIPLIGDTLDFWASPYNFVDKRVRKYGNISWAFPFFKHTAILSGPEGLAAFYNRALVMRADPTPTMMKAIAAGHILNLMDDETFRERRSLLLSAVKDHSAIDAYLPAIEGTMLRYMRKWNAMSNPTSPSVKHRMFRWSDELHSMCADISAAILLGVQDDEGVTGAWIAPRASAALAGLQSMAVPLPGFPYYKGTQASKELHSYVTDILRAHVNGSVGHNAPPHAAKIMVNEYNKHSRMESVEGLATELTHMILALQVLVGTALSDMMAALEGHPDVLSRVHEEVDAKLGEQVGKLKHTIGATTKGNLTTHALNKLTYTAYVADEVRRVYPVGPAGMYGVAKQSFTVQGRYVPKGWSVIGAFWSTDRDENEYSHPYEFLPERFAAHREPRHGRWFGWAPHGSGHHQCPGLDLTTYIMTTFLATLVRADCQWELAKQNLAVGMHHFNPSPKGGVQVRQFACSGL